MKIYILPVETEFQPERIPVAYPAYNSQYGVEQDFLEYLHLNPGLVTENKEEADWFYLPIYWTRWLVNHDYAQRDLHVLQAAVDKIDIDRKKLFTICQYDDGTVVDLHGGIQFLSSRMGKKGIDIPLLSSPITYDEEHTPERIFLASFAGRLHTHPLRIEMATLLQPRSDVRIVNGDMGIAFFVDLMLKSKIALCPRGYGGSSFRFYEAMQFGTIPFLIGDIDSRPFKKFINWDKCSFYTKDVQNLNSFLDSLKDADFEAMQKQVLKTRKELNYQNWCRYVIGELEDL